MNLRSIFIAGATAGALMLAACGGKDEGASADKAKPAEIELSKEAATKWETCATCHGNSGQGDGIAAEGFDPKPQSFANADFQKGITDEDLAKVILEGGPALGKSPLMPPNPDLDGKDEIIAELVQKVRSFAP